MKIFSVLCGLFILVLVLCFALSNQQAVALSFWPLSGEVQVPLYLIGLLPLISGLFLGGLWAWLASVPHRLRVRRLNKELGHMNERINELQKTTAVQQVNNTPKKSFWRRG
jgi:uncharacterized integral membrane protein